MITAICDKCKLSMVAGYICREGYFGDSFQGKLNWNLQQSKVDTKHLCYSCMNKVFLTNELEEKNDPKTTIRPTL